MKKSLVSLVVLALFLIFEPFVILGENIKTESPLTIDPKANLQDIPTSFCITEDGLFLIPDSSAGTIKIFSLNQNSLKFISELGRSGIDAGKFVRPKYSFYNQEKALLGVIDYGARLVYVFSRTGKTNFSRISVVPCKYLGDDIEFTVDGNKIIISGYFEESKTAIFDLYSLEIYGEKIKGLLPSYQKYNLDGGGAFIAAFDNDKKIPAIGVKGFFSINGDNLFYVWEGALRIIKMNLLSKKITTFGQVTEFYSQPDGKKLADLLKRGDLEGNFQLKNTMTYIKNIFATPTHVFLVYDVSSKELRLQAYTAEGKFLKDISLAGNPSSPTWFDKDESVLYAFSRENKKGLSILKYNVINLLGLPHTKRVSRSLSKK